MYIYIYPQGCTSILHNWLILHDKLRCQAFGVLSPKFGVLHWSDEIRLREMCCEASNLF